jgi:hypothetical protein
MSTDHQRYSIENQHALLQAYAVAHDMVIVRRYTDAGKSGVTLKGREGLTTLFADVESGNAPFKAVLVYDVSRWGRFQDNDESGYYEFLCRKAGVAVIYCAEQFGSDTSPYASTFKSLKRTMAGEFSRELGVKVATGKARLGGLGFRIGGVAGYGLRRRLLVDGVTPGALLKEGQWKSIQTDRVTLVPGPADEIALVRQIYIQYVYLRRSERDIADALNSEGHTFYGRPWTRNLVRNILANEKYIGNNVVGIVSARLFTRQVINPPEKWVRCEGAFKPIVPHHLFMAAEAVRRFNQKIHFSREDIIEGLRRVWKREGKLTIGIIRTAPELPHSHTVAAKFGSMTLAYEAVGYVPEPRYEHHSIQRKLRERRTELQQGLLDALVKAGISVRAARPSVLTLDNLATIDVQISRHQTRHAHDDGWRISYESNSDTDFVVAARLQPDGGSVKDYLLVPRHDLVDLPIFIRRSHEQLFKRYRYTSIAAIAKRLADSFRTQRLEKVRRISRAVKRKSQSGRHRVAASK